MSTREHHCNSARVYGVEQAKESLKAILDCSERGGLSRISRPGRAPAAVVNGENLRRYLASTIVPEVQVVNTDGAWALLMPGRPFAAESPRLEEAVEDFVDAMREYSDDWETYLHAASNHRENWGLVQLVKLSTDAQMAAWLTGSAT